MSLALAGIALAAACLQSYGISKSAHGGRDEVLSLVTLGLRQVDTRHVFVPARSHRQAARKATPVWHVVQRSALHLLPDDNVGFRLPSLGICGSASPPCSVPGGGALARPVVRGGAVDRLEHEPAYRPRVAGQSFLQHAAAAPDSRAGCHVATVWRPVNGCNHRRVGARHHPTPATTSRSQCSAWRLALPA